MEYTLMHKDIPVLDIDLDEATSSIQKIITVYHMECLPLGTTSKHDDADRVALNAWWIDRSIPLRRAGIRRALETLELPNTQMLLTRSLGLSLSDQYWVKPKGSGLEWERINFFTNPFSEDIGDVLLGKITDHAVFDFRSPDNTSEGLLKKRWKIIEGKRCLEWIGAAPLFDNGSSMGYDKLPNQILFPRGIACRPFKKTHNEQLKLVTSFDWLDFDSLNDVEAEIREVYDQAGDYMDEARKSAILSAFSSRLGNLMVLSEVQRPSDDIEQDVEQDITRDYGMKMDM